MSGSREKKLLGTALESPESLLAFSHKVFSRFYDLMLAGRVDEAWLATEIHARVFRAAPERFSEDPWNSKLAFALCKVEAVGALFMAQMCRFERSLQSCERALTMLRQRESFAKQRGEKPGWNQVRMYLVSALSILKWYEPQLREVLLSPLQLLEEWDVCLEAYNRCRDGQKGLMNRAHLLLCFESVMRAALLSGTISFDDYNERAREARDVIMLDFPFYPHPDPEMLKTYFHQLPYYYSLCFMLEACSPTPTTDRLKEYIDLSYRSSAALGLANREPLFRDYARRDCLTEFKIVMRRLDLRPDATDLVERAS